MKAKMVTTKELLHDNPTTCLSPHRAFNQCHLCPTFKNKYNKTKSVALTLQQVKCKPNIAAKYLHLMHCKRSLWNQINAIKEKIAEIDKQLRE